MSAVASIRTYYDTSMVEQFTELYFVIQGVQPHYVKIGFQWMAPLSLIMYGTSTGLAVQTKTQ